MTPVLVIGLMVKRERRQQHGFLKTGVSVGRAREVLKDIAAAKSASGPLDDGDDKRNRPNRLRREVVQSLPVKDLPPSNDVPFSKGSKVLFQQALELSETMNVGYIAPEHLCTSRMIHLTTMRLSPSLKNSHRSHGFTKRRDR